MKEQPQQLSLRERYRALVSLLIITSWVDHYSTCRHVRSPGMDTYRARLCPGHFGRGEVTSLCTKQTYSKFAFEKKKVSTGYDNHGKYSQYN